MRELIFRGRAPSNIALIKYMGKKDASANLPENGSISMSLDSLCTLAELRVVPADSFKLQWLPELPKSQGKWSDRLSIPEARLSSPRLSDSGIAKVIRHVERIREAAREILPSFGLQLRTQDTSGSSSATRGESWELRTANTFPQGSGIASSASSFAALTVVSALACARSTQAFEKVWARDPAFRQRWSRLSRLGSGSSCRSLEGPWVFWEEESVSVLPSQMPEMAHFVVLVSESEKQVSSSEAHLRVKGSPLWGGRVGRVTQRLGAMQSALALGDVDTVARIAWADSWEMHSLFHTSQVPFSYWEPATIFLLKELSRHWDSPSGRGIPGLPIVTLDAGPNLHVLVPAIHVEFWASHLAALAEKVFETCGFKPRILQDAQGKGADFGEELR